MGVRIEKIITSVYLLLLFVVFPLYVWDHYWSMAFSKWKFYLYITIPFIGIGIIWIIGRFIVKLFSRNKAGTKNVSVRNAKIPKPDIVLLYGVSSIITFLLCENKPAAWMGTDGWYMGFVAQILFVLTYLLMKNVSVSAPLVAVLNMIGMAGCAIVGICQRYGNDFLHLYWDMPAEVVRDYLSTIGNRSWYAGFVAVTFPLGVYLFWNGCGKKIIDFILAIYSGVCFATIVTLNTDSIYPGVAAVFISLLILSVGSRKKLFRFGMLCLSFSYSCLFMSWLRDVFPNKVRALRGISKIALNLSFDIVLSISITIIVLLYGIYISKNEGHTLDAKVISNIRIAILCIVGGGILLFILFVILNTTGALNGVLGKPIKNEVFYFDNQWADHRGFAWKYSLDMFSDMSIKDKLFGVGQDCFAYYNYSRFSSYEVLSAYWGNSVLSNVHNEWLNSILSFGLVGGFLYIGCFLSTIKNTLLSREREGVSPVAVGIGLCILSYFINNLFGYQQVCATTIAFVMMGIAASLIGNTSRCMQAGLNK